MTQTVKSRSEALRMAELYRKQGESLSARYQGVRPGWVSADLAYFEIRETQYRELADTFPKETKE